ncbi:MAG: hypothetical protein AAGA85_19405, partial [Bacteroidota bacterium]
DGMPMPLEVANNIPVHDVLFIDVLRGPEAAIYGSRGGSGVIAMYTRRGGEGSISQREPIGLTTLRLAGFTAPRQFHMPDHGNPSEDEKIRPDYRSTVYWNPRLEAKGAYAEDSFYTSDETGEFIIYSEGIGIDGRIYLGSTSFQVR